MARKKSGSGRLANPTVARLAADTVRKAFALGLLDDAPDFTELTYPTLRKVVARVREAGIGARAGARLARASRSDVEAISRNLRQIEALLDESPCPKTEWRRLLDVFERDRLGALVGASPSSVGRYERGERRTPDAVAARLHLVALVVGDLAGAYNEIGIRRWFERKRTALDGRAPAELLTGAWQPDDAGPAHVRELARSLVESPAT